VADQGASVKKWCNLMSIISFFTLGSSVLLMLNYFAEPQNPDMAGILPEFIG
jgi:hypothetical protein